VGERWQRFAAEVTRFLAVGLVATIVALILFNLLVHGFKMSSSAPLNDSPELAYVLANGVGMLISYHGTKTWAFKHRESRHADGGFLAFVVINLATMMIPITCLWISRNGFGLDDPISDNVSANVVGLALANAARFFLFRQLVFRRPLSDGPAPRRIGDRAPTGPTGSGESATVSSRRSVAVSPPGDGPDRER
jgi:putative flippase GtrA